MLDKNYKTIAETKDKTKELVAMAIKCGYKINDYCTTERYIYLAEKGYVTKFFMTRKNELDFWSQDSVYTYIDYDDLMQLLKAEIEPTIKPCPVCQGECVITDDPTFVLCLDCSYLGKSIDIKSEAIQWHNNIPRWYKKGE